MPIQLLQPTSLITVKESAPILIDSGTGLSTDSFSQLPPRPNIQYRWRLYLDDVRYPDSPDWTIARTSYDAQYFVTTFGMPVHMALDHDLGGADTTQVFLNWLEDQLMEKKVEFPKGFTYSVHSANPIGARWIELKMKDLLTYFT